jgi:hypothetical protein
VSGRQITTVATHTARSIGRRLVGVAAVRERADEHARPPVDLRADDARLDTLRGELVHELDRLAAADQGCSAGFRRI